MGLNRLKEKVEDILDKADETLENLEHKLFEEKTDHEIILDEFKTSRKQLYKFYRNNKSLIDLGLIVVVTVIITKLFL